MFVIGAIAMLVLIALGGVNGPASITGRQGFQSRSDEASSVRAGSPSNPTAEHLGSSNDIRLSGVYHNIKIITDHEITIASAERSGNLFAEYPSPELSLANMPGRAGATQPGSGLSSHDLPVEPMWHHTVSAMSAFELPSAVDDSIIDARSKSRPPHAILASPRWPSQEQPNFYDTVVVDGYLVLHSTGRVTFELISESHPNRGFADEVKLAMARSRCYPAFDSEGLAITVRCRYRCLFTDSDAPSVQVSNSATSSEGYDGSITATVLK